MKLNILTALAGSAMLALAAPAFAAPIIIVTPSVAPNVYGSPSFGDWADNSLAALLAGNGSAGTPGTPAYYQAQANVNAFQTVVTNFASWNGQTDPGTTFGPAFAGEYGNRLHFGLVINGNGSKFSIDQLGFSAVSSDPGNALAFAFPDGYDYSAHYVGIQAGTDNTLFTSDDIFITSGPASQQVDFLFSRGSGNALEALCTGCTDAQQKAAIYATASTFLTPTTFTGTYTLTDNTLKVPLVASGSGTFNISAVPEPTTWAMMIGGLALTGASLRRRKTAVRFA